MGKEEPKSVKSVDDSLRLDVFSGRLDRSQ
jgi:hypothetical protein